MGHRSRLRPRGDLPLAGERKGAHDLGQPGGWESRFPAAKSRSILIKRTSITLDDRVYESGLGIAAQRGFSQSFSAYIAWLIQRDAAGGVTREEAPSPGRMKAVKPKAKPAVKVAKPAAKSAGKAVKTAKTAKTSAAKAPARKRSSAKPVAARRKK